VQVAYRLTGAFHLTDKLSKELSARAATLTADDLAEISGADLQAVLDHLAFKDLTRAFASHWPAWRFGEQGEPEGDWRVWLLLAGRGFGKTRVGAQWVRAQAVATPNARIALVAATMAEARSVMIEGESGLLNAIKRKDIYDWAPSRAQLTWGNGARATLYSAENPEGLRGPQHHFAWCDELGKWGHPQATWDNLQLGMRLGERPRTLVTTTPRNRALLRSLINTPGVIVRRGRTVDNPYLPEAFTDAVHTLYAGTRLGRQELDGELIEEAQGALWTRREIEACRVRARPEVRRMVVAVDPPAGVGGDACGIVAVALGRDGCAYLVEDASVANAHPDTWARAVAACAQRNGADKVVAEANNGGKMVESVLRGAACAMPIKLVHAAHGKVARAEPVAALYKSARAFHVGTFPALEDELCGLVTGGGYEGPGRSPDRADALVWAMTELMLGKGVGEGPRVRRL
jgi:phage terminase large subunit-like protein